MKKTAISVFATLLLAGCAADANAACEVDGSKYAMRGNPSFTATFRKLSGERSARGLVLEIHSRETGRTFSFTINRGNGYGEATLLPKAGQFAGPVEIYTVDEAGAFSDYFGGGDASAPKQLLAPKLGSALWYDIEAVTGVENSPRERMPRAFFDRVACGLPSP